MEVINRLLWRLHVKPPTTRIATRNVDEDLDVDVAEHPSKPSRLRDLNSRRWLLTETMRWRTPLLSSSPSVVVVPFAGTVKTRCFVVCDVLPLQLDC